MTAEEIAEFRRTILGWYEEHGRAFPWRDTTDPWAILVSEVMLQQTQTSRVVPKYRAWLERFPVPEALASSPLQEALRHWSGLGYNRRARNLWETAKIIAGKGFPRTAGALRELPGIGPYTASAVATFAFNSPEVFIETNIRSLFIFFFFPPDTHSAVPDRAILPLVEETLDRENPRIWYYALMDYGAELKRKTPNPSRASAGYARQGRFKGSMREARGAILRALSLGGRAGLGAIGVREEIDYARLAKAADLLVAEGFIKEEGGEFFID
ncbi:MAG: A/G-specific adenine glycosylase [Spirochaetaceae bacterium]|jgi:A/G-specific adenine glycosylase|nr:A/G-specific adenine glycosylase [Spirochaetaceae bacterium]